MVLSLVLDVPIDSSFMFSHTFGSPSDAGKSRLSETRKFTLETLKFKEVINKQRMIDTELLLYLWLFFVIR